MKQAGIWGPWLQSHNARTWTHLSSSNKIQRNCVELKITACTCSWGKLETKDTKSPKNPTATSEELGAKTVSGAKARYWTCSFHTTPPQGWAKHLGTPPAWALDTPSALTPLESTWAGSKQGTLLPVLVHSVIRTPVLLPEILVWSLINFYWWRRPRILVGNNPFKTLSYHVITVDGDCSHEIRRRLLLGRKAMTNRVY